jgi:ribosomal-protein-alanine N-acetyltransferase
VLVPFAAADLDALHALWTDVHVRRYLWDDEVISRERAASTLEDALASAEADALGHWSLRQSRDGPIIGDCGLRWSGDPPEVELMCCLVRLFWRQGLALEACRAAV